MPIFQLTELSILIWPFVLMSIFSQLFSLWEQPRCFRFSLCFC